MRNSQAQDKFLRTLSASMHRMAQPLSIIQASLEMSLLEPTSAEQYKEVAKSALKELRRAVDSMHFSAQLARFQQPASDEAEVEISQIVEDVIDDLLRVFDTAQVKVLFSRPEHERPVKASPARVRQLMFYVLQAVQALSVAGDMVQVELRIRSGHMVFRVYHSPNHRRNSDLPAGSTVELQEGDVTSRALALADAIVTTAGGKFSVNASPLLIRADLPIAREHKVGTESKTKLHEGLGRFAANSH